MGKRMNQIFDDICSNPTFLVVGVYCQSANFYGWKYFVIFEEVVFFGI